MLGRLDERGRVLVALALAVAALGFAVVALVGPARVDRGRFEWSAAENPLDIPLVLSASRPRSIVVRVPCELARSMGESGRRQLFTTATQGRALAVVGEGRSLSAHVGNTKVVSLPVPSAGACDAVVRFESEPGELRLTVGEASADARLPRNAQPIVTGLHADPDAAGSELSARVVTQPTGSSPSRRQLLAIVLCIVCLLGATVLLLRHSRARDFGGWLPTPALAASDAAVAVAALASVLLTPAIWDDGWILAIVRGFGVLGRFSDYYATDAATLIQGGWWDALVYPVLSSTSNVVVLRLVPLLLTVLTWWVVRRWVIDQWGDGTIRRRARFAAAAMAVLVIPAWMTTLRLEPVIALLGAVSLAATVRFCLRPSIAALLTVLTMGALAITAHQTGWVVVTAAAPAMLFLGRWLREGLRLRLLALAAAVLVAASIGLLLIGLDTDLALLRRAAVDFTSTVPGSPGYLYGPFDEWLRPHDTIIYHSAVRRAAMLLPLLGVIAARAARPRTDERDALRFALWSSVAGSLGLLFTSSKLSWHYGAVMPFSIVLVGVGFQRLLADESRWRSLKRGMATVGLALVASWALSTALEWNEFDLSSKQWAELRKVDLLGGLDLSRPIVWLVGVALITGALTVLRLLKRGPSDVTGRLLAITLGAVCVVPVVLTWSFLVRDARATDGWSFTGQLLSSAIGRDACGLPKDLPVVASAVPLDRTAGPDDIRSAFPDAYLHVPTNRALPVADVDTWGTYAATEGRSRVATTGRFSTPWYALDGAGELAFWTVGRVGGTNRIIAEALGADDSVTAKPITRVTDSLYWSIHRVPALPRDAIAVRLVLEDADSGAGGWLAATAPATVTEKPFAATLSAGDRVWVAPQHYLYAPCVELPPISQGYVHPFVASVVTPPNFGIVEHLMSEGSVVETGCVAAGPCAYRVSVADAASLLAK
jgi:hypothetical protein